MSEASIQSIRHASQRGAVRSMFRCPECGSRFDPAQRDPHDGSITRKCTPCGDLYPVVRQRRALVPTA